MKKFVVSYQFEVIDHRHLYKSFFLINSFYTRQERYLIKKVDMPECERLWRHGAPRHFYRPARRTNSALAGGESRILDARLPACVPKALWQAGNPRE
jgi:hypothetical protein